MEWKKREKFGSGWVGSGERRSLPDSTSVYLFFRSIVTIAPFTVRLVLLAELLQLTVLSLEKLSIKATDVLFESIVEPLITIEESRQNEYNHLW